jgi:hypothetical protein
MYRAIDAGIVCSDSKRDESLINNQKRDKGSKYYSAEQGERPLWLYPLGQLLDPLIEEKRRLWMKMVVELLR